MRNATARMSTLLLLLPACGTGAIVATGTTAAGSGFYVSTMGNDANAGTLEQPFATLARAQQAMKNSSIKTTYVERGVYHITRTLKLTGVDSGETWTYYAPDGVDSAVLDGGTSTSTAFAIGASNVTIDGLKFQNFTGSDGATPATITVGVNDPSATTPSVNGVVIENNEVSSMTIAPPVQMAVFNQGIMVFNATNTLIANNYVHDIASGGISATAYYPGWTVDGTVISGNVVINTATKTSDAGAISIGMKATGDRDGHVTITNNFISGTGGPGFTSLRDIYLDDNASNVTVTGNILGPLAAGVSNTGGHSGNWLGAVFVHNGSNNTITGNVVDLGSSSFASVVAYGLDHHSLNGMANNRFTHNIILSNFTGAQKTINAVAYYEGPTATPASWFTIENNLYWNYAAGGSVFFNGSVAGDTHPITGVDPQIAGNTYTIADGSPVFNSPVNFPGIIGRWGPPGFVTPTGGLSSVR